MYASLPHVTALNAGRRITATSRPDATSVAGFLADTAAILDGILSERDYVLPIPTTATGALGVLRHFNALGAHAFIEEASPSGKKGGAEAAMAMWENAQKMLRDGILELDAPTNREKTMPRAPAACATPFFTRDLRF
jgi:hypothetical protein